MKIRISDLTLKIGARELVHQLNLTMNAGESWCIIGRNGAGKTTLVRTLAGLIETSGGIYFNDQPIAAWPLMKLAKVRSYLPQSHHDVFAHRVIETVLGARHPYSDGHYWESITDLTLAYAALAEMDVAHLAKRDVRSLSGGERQRVAIAALLAQDAQVMMLDEPTAALDLAHQVSAMQLFSECAERNKTVLMVSHDLNLARSVATHALLLMGDGSWLAGPVSKTMTPAALSECLGHPIEMIQHGDQYLFIPVKR